MRDDEYTPDAVLVEDKANGPAVIDTLKDKVSGLIAIEPRGSKFARASATSPQIEAGEIYLPHPDEEPWVEAFISEWCAVPNNAFWDQVDQSSQAMDYFQGHSAFDPTARRRRPRAAAGDSYLGGVGALA
jgi:predicted phage terminase large subunit-like protein